MFGQFQQSNIRLEVNASSSTIRDSLTQPEQLKKWLWMQRWEKLPNTLEVGAEFTTYLGVVPVTHRIELLQEQSLRFLLSQGIDGFHEWSWADGWLQSHLEGVSLLPLSLGQTVALLSLCHFVEANEAEQET